MNNVVPLPTGFQVHPATMGDLEAVAQVQIAHEIADFNTPLSSEASLRHTWQSPDIKMNLNVDILNSTGAFRLYERAGIHTLFQYHTYEKDFRAGKDLRVQ